MGKYDCKAAEMIKRYEQGEKVTWIGVAMGIPQTTVRRYIERNGRLRPKRKFAKPEDKKAKEAITKLDIARLKQRLKVGDEVPVLAEVQELERGVWKPAEKVSWRYVTELPPEKGMVVQVGQTRGKTSESYTYIDILMAVRRLEHAWQL